MILIKRKVRLKVIYLLYLAIPGFLVILFSLDKILEFRISNEEARKEFRKAGILARSGKVYVQERELNYMRTGNGNIPVLFLHGSPGAWNTFFDLMTDQELTSRFDMIAVDRPGFGYSDFGKPEPKLTKQANLMAEVFRSLNSRQKAIVVGHSLGGPLAVKIALQHPELVSGLILIAPSLNPALEPDEWYRPLLRLPVIRGFIPPSMYASNEEILPLKSQLSKMIPKYPEIKVPTTVIQGGNDFLVDPGNADFVEKHFYNADIVQLGSPEDDHFIPWTNPDIIVTALLRLAQKQKATPFDAAY